MEQIRIISLLKFEWKNGVVHQLNINELATRLGMSSKTLKRHLNMMQKRNWIGKDSKRYFLRSWRRILIEEKTESKFRVLIPKQCQKILYDLEKFKTYLFASNISVLVNSPENKMYRLLIIGGITPRAFSPGIDIWKRLRPLRNTKEYKYYQPCAISHISSKLNISLRSANTLKKNAIKHGFISFYKKYEKLEKIHKTKKKSQYNAFDFDDPSINLIKSRLVKQYPDSIISHVEVKRFKFKR